MYEKKLVWKNWIWEGWTADEACDPSGPKRGGKYGEGVPRTGHVDSLPLADSHDRFSGGACG